MASWQTLRDRISAEYRVEYQDDSMVKLIFDLADSRTQIVLVSRELVDGREWAQIVSPFASAQAVNLVEVLEQAALFKAGGVVKVGDELWIRHAVPLADLDMHEFIVPLNVVVLAADALEARFSPAGDQY